MTKTAIKDDKIVQKKLEAIALNEEKKANRAFDKLMRMAKSRGALISYEEISKAQDKKPTTKLF